MLAIGILLTLLGLFLFGWAAEAQSKPRFQRPLIFNRVIPVIIILILCLGLLFGGLYCLWKVSPIIVFAALAAFLALWSWGYFLGCESAKAKRIFRIYQKLALFRPTASEEELLRETSISYFRQSRWDEFRIETAVKGIDAKNVKDLATDILLREILGSEFDVSGGLESYWKKAEKRERAVEHAFRKILGKKIAQSERPVISRETRERLIKAGLDPDEMTNGQLASLESLENPKKSHWSAKPFIYIGSYLGYITVLSIIKREWESILLYGLIGLVCAYVGYRIQAWISSKRFIQASIEEYARQQRSQGARDN